MHRVMNWLLEESKKSPRKSGTTRVDICEVMDMSRSTLYNKLRTGGFTLEEVDRLARHLGYRVEIVRDI